MRTNHERGKPAPSMAASAAGYKPNLAGGSCYMIPRFSASVVHFATVHDQARWACCHSEIAKRFARRLTGLCGAARATVASNTSATNATFGKTDCGGFYHIKRSRALFAPTSGSTQASAVLRATRTIASAAVASSSQAGTLNRTRPLPGAATGAAQSSNLADLRVAPPFRTDFCGGHGNRGSCAPSRPADRHGQLGRRLTQAQEDIMSEVETFKTAWPCATRCSRGSPATLP